MEYTEAALKAIDRLHGIDMNKPPQYLCYLDRYLNSKFLERQLAPISDDMSDPESEYHAVEWKYLRSRNL